MVKAAADRVVAVYVDCTMPEQNKALQAKYKIEGYPTLLFVDPTTEKPVADVYPQDAKSFVAEIEKIAKEHPVKK